MKLKKIEEEQSKFRVPWYILDPTGDVVRRQRKAARGKKAQVRDLVALREADADGDGEFSMDELRAYQQNQRVSKRWRWFKFLSVHLVDPSDLTLYPAWDIVTAIALLFTAAVTPCEHTPSKVSTRECMRLRPLLTLGVLHVPLCRR